MTSNEITIKIQELCWFHDANSHPKTPRRAALDVLAAAAVVAQLREQEPKGGPLTGLRHVEAVLPRWVLRGANNWIQDPNRWAVTKKGCT